MMGVTNRPEYYFDSMVLPSVELPLKESYNIKEVCQILGVGHRTIQRYIQDKKLIAGPHKRIYASELRRFFGYV
jgi:excisionase family DNA binding protein